MYISYIYHIYRGGNKGSIRRYSIIKGGASRPMFMVMNPDDQSVEGLIHGVFPSPSDDGDENFPFDANNELDFGDAASVFGEDGEVEV
jgi:hypothetical protein